MKREKIEAVALVVVVLGFTLFAWWQALYVERNIGGARFAFFLTLGLGWAVHRAQNIFGGEL